MEKPEKPTVTASRRTARPKKPEPKATADPKPGAVKPKKKVASVETAAYKPTTPKLVVLTQSSTCPLKEIFHIPDHLPRQACVELTRQLLMSVSTLPTEAGHPRAVLKRVILVAKYGSTP
jgi:hypothetical protein